MEFKSTNSVAGSQLLPARSRAWEVSKGDIMTNTYSATRTCDTCERPALVTYSNGDGTTEVVCGYHNYLITRVAEFCPTCEKQAYVGSCYCEG
jgi:hypothetical protein